jgi:hypothetical protein
MKTLQLIFSLLAMAAGLTGCFKDNSGNTGDFGIEPPPSVARISLSYPGKYGVLDGEPGDVTGAPIAAVQGDKAISVAPGASGTFQLGYANVPANTAFDLRFEFSGVSRHRFIIPISAFNSHGLDSGEFSIPYSVPADACEGLEATVHLIPGTVAIQVGNNPPGPTTSFSFVLNCGSTAGFSGPGSYCAYNYPRSACESLVSNQLAYGQWFFNPGRGISACGRFSAVENVYDYGFQGSGQGDDIGACAWAPIP